MAALLKSDYEAVSRKSLQEEEEDEALQCSDNAAPSEDYHDRCSSNSTFRKHRLTYLNLALLLVQIVLVGWYLSQVITRKHATVEKEYGRDYDYMSLDHKYDHLWEQDAAANEAGIIILKDHGGRYGEVEHGAISM
ncbi:hypothetical protein MBLNU459_g5976t1 [Dothideomycetes sp. NU459]